MKPTIEARWTRQERNRKERKGLNAIQQRAVREYNRAGISAAVTALGAGDADHWEEVEPEVGKPSQRAEKRGVGE